MILNELTDILFSYFSTQYPINLSKLHHKTIPFASLLWHTQMAPSFIQSTVAPCWHHILFFTLPCNKAICVFISPFPSLQVVGLLLENRDFFKPQLSLTVSMTCDLLIYKFSELQFFLCLFPFGNHCYYSWYSRAISSNVILHGNL